MKSLFDDIPTISTGEHRGVPQYQLPSAPLASPADPVTSHEAAERHVKSGKAKHNAAIVLSMVRRYPGLTSVELHAAQGDRSDLDRHEVSRRLADLKNAGRVRQGPAKDCSIKRTAMVSWFAID